MSTENQLGLIGVVVSGLVLVLVLRFEFGFRFRFGSDLVVMAVPLCMLSASFWFSEIAALFSEMAVKNNIRHNIRVLSNFQRKNRISRAY